MLNETATIATAPTSAAPYSVDVSKGGHDGNVSKQWMSRPADQRFATLTELFESKRDAYRRSWEARVRTHDFEVITPKNPQTTEDLQRLTVGLSKVRFAGSDVVRSVEVAPTHWAFGQLCQRSGSPAAFIRELPSPIARDIINYRMRFDRSVEEVKTFGDPSQLFAATGPTYGRIPDYEVVDALRNLAGDGLGRDGFHWKTPGEIDWQNGTYDPEKIGDVHQRTFFGSDRDMFVFLVDDRRPINIGKTRDGRDDNLFRGFYIQNSEVGARSLKLATFLLRGVCMNRNIWGQEGFEEITIRHTTLAPARWLEQMRPALENYASGSERGVVEAANKLKAAEVAADDNAALAFLRARDLSGQQARAIMELHEKEEKAPIRSAWDAIQGITAFARSAINNDARLDLELVGKKIADKIV